MATVVRPYRYRNVTADGDADRWRRATTGDDAVCGVYRHRDPDRHTAGAIQRYEAGAWVAWMTWDYNKDLPRCTSRHRETSPAGKRSSWICQLDADHPPPHMHLTGHRRWL